MFWGVTLWNSLQNLDPHCFYELWHAGTRCAGCCWPCWSRSNSVGPEPASTQNPALLVPFSGSGRERNGSYQNQLLRESLGSSSTRTSPFHPISPAVGGETRPAAHRNRPNREINQKHLACAGCAQSVAPARADVTCILPPPGAAVISSPDPPPPPHPNTNHREASRR